MSAPKVTGPILVVVLAWSCGCVDENDSRGPTKLSKATGTSSLSSVDIAEIGIRLGDLLSSECGQGLDPGLAHRYVAIGIDAHGQVGVTMSHGLFRGHSAAGVPQAIEKRLGHRRHLTLFELVTSLDLVRHECISRLAESTDDPTWFAELDGLQVPAVYVVLFVHRDVPWAHVSWVRCAASTKSFVFGGIAVTSPKEISTAGVAGNAATIVRLEDLQFIGLNVATPSDKALAVEVRETTRMTPDSPELIDVSIDGEILRFRGIGEFEDRIRTRMASCGSKQLLIILAPRMRMRDASRLIGQIDRLHIEYLVANEPAPTMEAMEADRLPDVSQD